MKASTLFDDMAHANASGMLILQRFLKFRDISVHKWSLQSSAEHADCCNLFDVKERIC